MPVSAVEPLLSAGSLDRRIRLLSPVYNAWEDDISDWQYVGSVWAAVEPAMLAPVESASSQRTVSRTAVVVVIRYRPDIDARWRIEDGPHKYEVLGLADIARRRVQLRLQCEEVT